VIINTSHPLGSVLGVVLNGEVVRGVVEADPEQGRVVVEMLNEGGRRMYRNNKLMTFERLGEVRLYLAPFWINEERRRRIAELFPELMPYLVEKPEKKNGR